MAEMRILLLNGLNLNTALPNPISTARARLPTSSGWWATGQSRPERTAGFQSNVEGEMIDWLQREAPAADGLIINAASYTHTSLALRDTITAVAIPAVEVHISNIYRREEFRHHSYISPVCVGGIFGLGVQGYELAVDALLRHIKGTGRSWQTMFMVKSLS